VIAVVTQSWRVSVEDLDALEELVVELAQRTQETTELERSYAGADANLAAFLGVNATVVYDEDEEPE